MQCVFIMFLLAPSPLGSYPPPYPSHYVISHTCTLFQMGGAKIPWSLLFLCGLTTLRDGTCPATRLIYRVTLHWRTDLRQTLAMYFRLDLNPLCKPRLCRTYDTLALHACWIFIINNTWGTFLVICMGKLYIWQDFRGNTFVNKDYGNKIKIESELFIL